MLHQMAGIDADRDPPADEVLRFVCEQDALERVQPRIDAWLRVAIGAGTEHPGPQPSGEGPDYRQRFRLGFA